VRPYRSLLQKLVVLIVGAVAGVGALASPVTAADPVGGPNGPEIACVNPLVSPGQPLKCRLSGFAPDVPVVISIAGAGDVATVRPAADGTRSIDLDWPFDRYGYHRVSAVQRAGASTRQSTTNAARGRLSQLEPGAASATDPNARSDATDRTSPPAPDEPVAEAITEPVDRGESQVPLRVSVAIGFGVAGLVVLFVRQRSRSRVGL